MIAAAKFIAPAKERPILFSAPMVRALLADQKTQTRRVCRAMERWTVQDCREVRLHNGRWCHFMKGAELPVEKLRCPYGQPGDRLWVRERHAFSGCMAGEKFRDWNHPEQAFSEHLKYFADGDGYDEAVQHWRPSIHMPRWASRIALEIVSVRMERAHDISNDDAVAEGIEPTNFPGTPSFKDYLNAGGATCDPRKSFGTLWASINGLDSWSANPWVWVVEFKRAEKTQTRRTRGAA